MTLDPNARQIGGDHYKTRYEHWDLMLKLKIPYLEGTATKYVSRWRKKDGLKDLQKAEHYVDKIIESRRGGYAAPPQVEIWKIEEIQKFADLNSLDYWEHDAIVNILFWLPGSSALERARDLIRSAINVQIVPKEDSNRHAL